MVRRVLPAGRLADRLVALIEGIRHGLSVLRSPLLLAGVIAWWLVLLLTNAFAFQAGFAAFDIPVGFAGALQEFGLPTQAVIPALAAFNIGVEIGQVAIVLLIFPALLAIDRLAASGGGAPARPRLLVYGLSGAIAALAVRWLVMRVMMV